MPDLSRPRSTNCLARIAAWLAGTKTNRVSGLASRARCRNGEKSGFASGTLRVSTTEPPACVNVDAKTPDASCPGAQSDAMMVPRLEPFCAAHLASTLACCAWVQLVRTKYGERSVTMDVPDTMTTVAVLLSVTSGA